MGTVLADNTNIFIVRIGRQRYVYIVGTILIIVENIFEYHTRKSYMYLCVQHSTDTNTQTKPWNHGPSKHTATAATKSPYIISKHY